MSNHRILITIGLTALIFFPGCATAVEKERTWSIYKGDASSSNYSPLDQINVSNVSQLKHVWSFTIQDKKAGSRAGRSQCNPIIVDGVLYATSASQWAYAINAATGKQIWSFDPFNGGEDGEVNRGLAYWENGDDRRILFSAANFLYALDARSGKPIPEFGINGRVDLKAGLRDSTKDFFVSSTSPGIIYKDLLPLIRQPHIFISNPMMHPIFKLS